MYKKLLLLPLLFSLALCSSKDENLEKLLKITKDNMVFVKGGTFMMGDFGATADIKDKYGYNLIGSPENRKKYPDANWLPVLANQDSRPLHKVTLDDFYISKYEVTWEEFDLYSKLIGKELYKKEHIGKNFRKQDRPVKVPSWNSAKNYCKYLSKATNKNYDLPTEAQWEYSARSGGKYVYFATDTGRGIMDRSSINPRKEHQNMANKTSKVGSFSPNPLGLYDMSSNKWEWVDDWYDKDYYKNSDELNPKGPKTGTEKVSRGGGQGHLSQLVFIRNPKELTYPGIGFRCVLNPRK